MSSMNVPYFDPPRREGQLTMNAAKMLQSIRNLAGQMAERDGSPVVTEEHTFNAVRMFMDNASKAPDSLWVPSSISVNRDYKPL